MRYINIFTDGQSDSTDPGVFDCDNVIARTECGRGVVLKWHRRAYHYLVDGRLVTIRAGGGREMLQRITDHITHGAEPDDYWLKRCADFYHRHTSDQLPDETHRKRVTA